MNQPFRYGQSALEALQRNNATMASFIAQQGQLRNEDRKTAQQAQQFQQQLAVDQLSRMQQQAWQDRKIEQQHQYQMEQAKLDFDLRRQSADYQAAKALEVRDLQEFGLDPENMLREARSIFPNRNLHSDQMATQLYREGLRKDKEKKDFEHKMQLGEQYADHSDKQYFEKLENAKNDVIANPSFTEETKKNWLAQIENLRVQRMLATADRQMSRRVPQSPQPQPEWGKPFYNEAMGVWGQENNQTGRFNPYRLQHEGSGNQPSVGGGRSSGHRQANGIDWMDEASVFDGAMAHAMKQLPEFEKSLAMREFPVLDANGQRVVKNGKEQTELIDPGDPRWGEATEAYINSQLAMFRRVSTNERQRVMQQQMQQAQLEQMRAAEKQADARKRAVLANTSEGTPGIDVPQELWNTPEGIKHAPLYDDPIRWLEHQREKDRIARDPEGWLNEIRKENEALRQPGLKRNDPSNEHVLDATPESVKYHEDLLMKIANEATARGWNLADLEKNDPETYRKYLNAKDGAGKNPKVRLNMKDDPPKQSTWGGYQRPFYGM
ncbi:MAG: hypothetical protein FWC56_05260 [Phycisphaerae bacterium]|nr:hypothetical protein [Phycisphaerae bacterium]